MTSSYHPQNTCTPMVSYLTPFNLLSVNLDTVKLKAFPTLLSDYESYFGTDKNQTFLYPFHELKMSISHYAKEDLRLATTWFGMFDMTVKIDLPDDYKQCDTTPLPNVISIEGLEVILKAIFKAKTMTEFLELSISLFHEDQLILFVNNRGTNLNGKFYRENENIQIVNKPGQQRINADLNVTLYNLSANVFLKTTGPLLTMGGDASLEWYNASRISLADVYFGEAPFLLTPFFDMFSLQSQNYNQKDLEHLKTVPVTETLLSALLKNIAQGTELFKNKKGFVGFFDKNWNPFVTYSRQAEHS